MMSIYGLLKAINQRLTVNGRLHDAFYFRVKGSDVCSPFKFLFCFCFLLNRAIASR